jgi:hypothetical protein
MKSTPGSAHENNSLNLIQGGQFFQVIQQADMSCITIFKI